MEIVRDLKNLMREGASVRRKIGAESDKLATRIADLTGERDNLIHLPLSRSDLENALAHDIAQAGEELMREDYDLCLSLKECRDRPSVRVEDPANCANYSPIPRKVDGPLLALLLGPDRVLSALKPLLDKLDYAQSGPPLAERRARLKEIDAELRELTSQKAELDQALGVSTGPAKVEPSGPKIGDRIKIGNNEGTWAQPTPFGQPGVMWDQPAR